MLCPKVGIKNDTANSLPLLSRDGSDFDFPRDWDGIVSVHEPGLTVNEPFLNRC